MTEEKDDFYFRVNYIAACIKKGSLGGPKFIDRFFTRGDAEYIVAALMRKAANDRKLDQAIQDYVGKGYFDLILTAGQYNHLNKQELKEWAKIARSKKL